MTSVDGRRVHWRNCDSQQCRAEIVFVPNERTNGYLVLDREPDPNGNTFVTFNALGLPQSCRVMRKDELAELDLRDPAIARHVFISHFATCPDRERFRKGKR